MISLNEATIAGKVLADAEEMGSQSGTFVRFFVETVTEYNGEETKQQYEIATWNEKLKTEARKLKKGDEVLCKVVINSKVNESNGRRFLNYSLKLIGFTKAEYIEFNTGPAIDSPEMPF